MNTPTQHDGRESVDRLSALAAIAVATPFSWFLGSLAWVPVALFGIVWCGRRHAAPRRA
ncbi:MAG: hypothetical protein QF903_09425 [Planctomycetota bacterium]|jgi:hypothetical protein|nr:hypothetical protein [Planctomycetota bacterium]MDP6763820.1 hypothetical protein [Planctomycetota bacterium]MDP6989686.1 hypothetical protein [Planctomycetota bacterium]